MPLTVIFNVLRTYKDKAFACFNYAELLSNSIHVLNQINVLWLLHVVWILTSQSCYKVHIPISVNGRQCEALKEVLNE